MPITTHITLILTLTLLTSCQYLIFDQSSSSSSPSPTKIKFYTSPIGFRPKIGSLHGKIVLAEPLSACTAIAGVEYEENEDIFVMVDDEACMESVKAKNVADSGAYVGIVKRNYNRTEHDREIDTVHIPILEIQPTDFNNLVSTIIDSKEKSISALADFTPDSQSKKMQIQLWLSPTQTSAYTYITQLSSFLASQSPRLSFQPHFVLHSQQSRATQYLGCLSSGRYCPPELEFEGTPAGGKIVGEALRQVIIARGDIGKWYAYAGLYVDKCLGQAKQYQWKDQNSQLCSENVMMMADINTQEVFQEYKNSFQGLRPEVDPNTYLEQQRQLYLQQKLSQFPILLINGKPYPLSQNPPTALQKRLCTMFHPTPALQPPECQKLTNPSFFSTGQLMIVIAFMINFLICLMVACRVFIRKRMEREIHEEVDGTLAQYYRYMETFEEGDLGEGRYVVASNVGGNGDADGDNRSKEKEEREKKEEGSIQLSEYGKQARK